MPTYYIDCAGQGRGRESVRVKGQILLARINSCISNRMYVRVTVGRRDPAVELTWKYLQRVTSTYMRLLLGQLIVANFVGMGLIFTCSNLFVAVSPAILTQVVSGTLALQCFSVRNTTVMLNSSILC